MWWRTLSFFMRICFEERNCFSSSFRVQLLFKREKASVEKGGGVERERERDRERTSKPIFCEFICKILLNLLFNRPSLLTIGFVTCTHTHTHNLFSTLAIIVELRTNCFFQTTIPRQTDTWPFLDTLWGGKNIRFRCERAKVNWKLTWADLCARVSNENSFFKLVSFGLLIILYYSVYLFFFLFPSGGTPNHRSSTGILLDLIIDFGNEGLIVFLFFPGNSL